MTQYIVALTGGIGSGKSTVANTFAALGVPLVDADVIAREVVQPESAALRAIVQRFGPAMLSADGSLDRAALRARIFSDPAEKTWLNGLLHPLIQRQTEQQLRSARAPYVLWVVPMLIENNLQQRANRVLVVDVDRERQIARTISRDGVSREQVENILAAQVSRQRRLACADDIIDNSGRPEEITDRVATLHQRYLALAASATRQDKSS
ncbi:Dephospho-CoA kinase [Sodalis glossinidius str. 'morsitans']|uniref:Dephospho-CoA kinase n=2 Tax=Sodalis glossinidius (strain morsitans) TaxID=343509 RepID=COAE_SODGM|nr:dephospho-CoA kinase [Sodalis glossinidius]Q2NVT9.1 RecName: Full=Dephospho-CoA kinase; AltName: Full=Dephosphocoenzyme A kinase [Sodalis glossinidius str. 'morsitans']BAE73736.1 dephospho-CoA kinase [Sodalis glossinidius str. 'morsitans']CRL44146.1 Dephospho-CoA kinase [Sodalis glossinidius str. 'morsitans']